MTAKAWIGLAMAQGDLRGCARVLGLMMYYGWTDRESGCTTNGAKE